MDDSICRRLIPLSALALLVFWMLGAPARAATLAVGGFNSQGANPGLFNTARLIDPKAAAWTLSGTINPTQQAIEYGLVEDAVFKRARQAIKREEQVNILGYSYGATLVLRVVHRLANDQLPLKNVHLVTVDRIGVGYPLLPVFHTVPKGLGSSLNVYQKTSRVLQGGEVTGAMNRAVTGEIREEKRLGRIANPFDGRFLQHPHLFIENSDHVRRLILETFEIAYLPGLWDLYTTADHGAAFGAHYVVYEKKGRFESKAWTSLGKFVKYSGYRGAGLTGEFFIPTYAAGCPELGVAFAFGVFAGGANPSRDELKLFLDGSWPKYYPSTCESAGYGQFTGRVVGSRSRLLSLTGSRMGSPEYTAPDLRPLVADSLGVRGPETKDLPGEPLPMTPMLGQPVVHTP